MTVDHTDVIDFLAYPHPEAGPVTLYLVDYLP